MYESLAVVIFLILLVFFSSLQIVRVSVRKRKSELLAGYLSGATMWFLRRGVFVETLSLLFSALAFASIIIVMVFSVSAISLTRDLEIDLLRQWGVWLLLAESMCLIILTYLAVLVGVQSPVLGKMCKEL